MAHSTDGGAPRGGSSSLPAGLAARFARLAVANVTREYPNFPGHLVGGPDDLAAPRSYHPAFYGSYDWHSAVHMHWLLVRLLRLHHAGLDGPVTGEAREVLDRHLTSAALAAEAGYLRAHPTFERPYGWAWLLALAAECAAPGNEDGAHNDAPGAGWAAALRPAAATVAELVTVWLGKATYPVRHGVHANSAFALGLILDAADRAGCPELTGPVADAARHWFGADRGYPAEWEPSGHDFLSPALTEADLMRRVLPGADFAEWLSAFLPGLADGRPQSLLTPPTVSDPHDPQIGHLIGLALSRATALRGIAAALPAGDRRILLLAAAAQTQLDAGLPHVIAGDFSSDHWLATFATLALDAPSPPTT